jgi:ribosomal protein S18 acetylase RimI-like enzyme
MGAQVERSEPVRGATWDDFDAVVELLARQSRAAGGVAAVRPEFVRVEWELPSFEVGRDNWLAGAEGYASLRADGAIVLAARDEATADALLERLAARARERRLAAIQLTRLRRDETHTGVIERHAFELQTDLLAMWRSLAGALPAAGWPEGISVRAFEPADAQAVRSLLDEAYRGWDRNYVPLVHEDWVTLMTGDVEFDPTVWFLAEREGALAGCALHWSSGWLKDVAVRESERGHGLGAALVSQGLAEFARRGLRKVGLKVDARNPTGAVRLYERLGFVTAQREEIWALNL